MSNGTIIPTIFFSRRAYLYSIASIFLSGSESSKSFSYSSALRCYLIDFFVPSPFIQIDLELGVGGEPPPVVVEAQRDLVQVEVLELRAELFLFFVDVGLVVFDRVLLLLTNRKREVTE